MSVTKKQATELLNLLEKEERLLEAELVRNNLDRAKRSLKTWGIVNAYKSCCGYKDVSSMFTELYPKKMFLYVENEIEFIDACILDLKKSNNKKDKEMALVADYLYKGFDYVKDGKDGSYRLNASLIADEIDISERTVYRRINALNSNIAYKLSNAII